MAPNYLTELVNIISKSVYNLRRNQNGTLLEKRLYKTKKTLGDRSFEVAAPVLWNSLPLEGRTINNIDSFKTFIKTYLFQKFY